MRPPLVYETVWTDKYMNPTSNNDKTFYPSDVTQQCLTNCNREGFMQQGTAVQCKRSKTEAQYWLLARK